MCITLIVAMVLGFAGDFQVSAGLSRNESALLNISTSFPPKTLKLGTPKSEIGMGREIQVFCRISTETLGPGNSGKFILGTPFSAFWGDFLGGNETPKIRGGVKILIFRRCRQKILDLGVKSPSFARTIGGIFWGK